MKRGSRFLAAIVSVVLVLSFVAIPLCAGKSPNLKLETNSVQLGDVYNNQSCVSFVIKFVNKGRDKLRITDIRTSCPCLTTVYPHGLLERGDEGEIKCTLNLQNFTAGKFEKKLQIFSNSQEVPQVVVVQGEYKYKE